MDYMITGEYPRDEQYNEFRDDVKVLKFCSSLEEAKKAFRNFDEQKFELLKIRSFEDVYFQRVD